MKIFIHNIESINCEILIIVGVKKAEDIQKYIKKNGTKEAQTLLSKKNIEEFNELIKNSAGFLSQLTHEKTNTIYYFLWLEKYGNNWEDNETLLHEIVHLKQFQWEGKNISIEEKEFEAYFIQNTFRSIRRRLFKELKI